MSFFIIICMNYKTIGLAILILMAFVSVSADFIVVDIDITKQPQIASKYKVMGTPTCVFLDSKGNEVQRIEGYVSAGEFLNLIKEI